MIMLYIKVIQFDYTLIVLPEMIWLPSITRDHDHLIL